MRLLTNYNTFLSILLHFGPLFAHFVYWHFCPFQLQLTKFYKKGSVHFFDFFVKFFFKTYLLNTVDRLYDYCLVFIKINSSADLSTMWPSALHFVYFLFCNFAPNPFTTHRVFPKWSNYLIFSAKLWKRPKMRKIIVKKLISLKNDFSLSFSYHLVHISINREIYSHSSVPHLVSKRNWPEKGGELVLSLLFFTLNFDFCIIIFHHNNDQ